MKVRWPVLAFLLLVVVCVSSPLFADPAAKASPGIDSGDTAWMLVSAALVLLMTPGLAFFYGGLVRRKNILSVLMQCFMAMCLMTVLWVIIGYSLAFSDESMLGGLVGNFKYLCLNHVGFEPKGTIPHQLFMIFQAKFAIITPALIVGAFAGRMRFQAYMLFTGLWLLIVYCPVCHWVWGGATGFFGLGSDGALDFAGGTVVHVNAGVAALAAVLVMRKRQGYPDKISPPHNLPFAVLGAGLLWVGWFGFNAGSALAANASGVNAFVVTHVSSAMAGLTWAILDLILHKKATMLGVITGAVAGLVAITPASGSVTAMGALGIGGGASLVAFFAVSVIKPKFGYDDSLDVFGVHGMAGIWGSLATGLWATALVPGNGTNGLFHGNPWQVVIQGRAVIYTIVWSGVMSWILLKLVDATVGLRVSDHEERVGLDIVDHSEAAYTVLD
ncbi:MAG: ammonium transporter [Planctomycetes bacterium]|nr:ammonium transporter [Planctomycetota bacterium]